MLVDLMICAAFMLSEPAEPDTEMGAQSVTADAISEAQPSDERAVAAGKADTDTKDARSRSTTERGKAAEDRSKTGIEDALLPIERNIIHYTNHERSKRGLPPLEVDMKLMQSARKHTAWMTRRQSLVHTSGPVAENIAMGQRNSREAVGDWMNSSGHRANILGRTYRRIGVAAYRAANGRIYWCQQFRN